MYNSRFAFTMIELIFVIVILGILSAVAIPKLAATRNDALSVRVASNIVSGVGEIASYVVAKNKVESNLSNMSNAVAMLASLGYATLDNNKTVVVKFGNINDCVTIKVFSSMGDENLTISFGNPSGDALCANLQSIIDIGQYSMKIKGRTVVF